MKDRRNLTFLLCVETTISSDNDPKQIDLFLKIYIPGVRKTKTPYIENSAHRKIPYGENSGQRKFRTAKFPYSKKSMWPKFRTGKILTAKNPTAKSLKAEVPSAPQKQVKNVYDALEFLP